MIYFDNSDDNQKTEENNTQEVVKEDKKSSEEGFKFAVCGDPHANWDVYEKVFKVLKKGSGFFN